MEKIFAVFQFYFLQVASYIPRFGCFQSEMKGLHFCKVRKFEKCSLRILELEDVLSEIPRNLWECGVKETCG